MSFKQIVQVKIGALKIYISIYKFDDTDEIHIYFTIFLSKV